LARQRPKLQAPRADELEVSVFGPGVGECIALHLGSGAWAVVDSCVDADVGQPVALKYLEDLGVDPAAAVRCIVLSHWHDDHVSGAADLVKACPNAVVVCSAALRSPEFLALVAASRRSMSLRSGVDQLRRIADLLRDRAPKDAAGAGPELAIAGKLLWRGGGIPNLGEAEIHSLSPSSAAIHIALQGFTSFMPKVVGKPKNNIVAQPPNHVAVALWVSLGPFQVLLGSDVETTSQLGTGWNAIVASTTRPIGRATTFKVAHHGSPNGDHPGIWTTLLTPTPFAVVTPFRRGATPRPAPTDLRRLKGQTVNLYCTAPLRGPAPPKRDAMVDRIAEGVARNRRRLSGKMGHVCARTNLAGTPAAPAVQVYGRAFRVP